MKLKLLKMNLDWMKRLSKRERIILKAGSSFLSLLLGYFLFLSPIFEKMTKYDREARQKEKELVEMKSLKEDYEKLKARIDQIEMRIGQESKGFSFPSFLENLAVENNLKNKMTSLRPQSSQSFENLNSSDIEVRLEDVALGQSVAFLSKIESAPSFLYIKQLHIKTRYSDPKNLDLTLVVSHYEKLP